MQPVPESILDANGNHILGRDLGEWTGDLEVVRNARVSYDADWRTGDSEYNDNRLMNTIMFEEHTSPLEAMVFTFEVQVPIFITRQWHRHRTWSYNEVSARYAPLPDVFFLAEPDKVGVQSTSSKQASDFNSLSEAERIMLESDIDAVAGDFEKAYARYEDLIERGWPRERARTVLPVGIYTRFFATVDLHNLFHFMRLRLHEHAQYEIRVYAEAMLELITPVVPVSAELFRKRLDQQQTIEKIRKICKEEKWDYNETLTQLHSIVLDWKHGKRI